MRVYIEESDLTTKSSLYDRLRVRTVQTVAMVRLLAARWIEPPRMNGLHLSTLIQQILALIAQHGGATAQRAWDMLCCGGPFANVDEACFVATLRTMGAHGLIEQAVVASYYTARWASASSTTTASLPSSRRQEEYSLVAGNKRIGSLPIDRPLQPDVFPDLRRAASAGGSGRHQAPGGSGSNRPRAATPHSSEARPGWWKIASVRKCSRFTSTAMSRSFLTRADGELLAEGRAEFERLRPGEHPLPSRPAARPLVHLEGRPLQRHLGSAVPAPRGPCGATGGCS